ncbi:glycosyltransferase [Pseudobutyrivibrio sp.]|uniref:glycosyltransferase n=1 Tax=Pseudobutyrivibrio sp. TaxID=2014367 RepID=UPI001B563E94|nr:glycosyltransferase [Pseudobutyrivibrio sp.]MBP3263088.1 glycosyltransferase [Pseudobutyrivibrio sp.]
MIKEPIHVAHMIPMGAGGISTLTISMYDLMDHDKIQYSYLMFRDKTEFYEEKVKKSGCKKIIVDTEKMGALKKFYSKIICVGKALKQNDVDIMHIDASSPYDVIIAISAKLGGVKTVIMHSHNDNFEKDANKIRNLLMPFFKFLIPWFVDYYIACSRSAAEFMFPKRIMKEKEVLILKNGIVADKYVFDAKTRQEIRAQYNLADKFVIGHVGRFVEQKNHDFLIDIFYEVQKINPNAVLLLIGTGEYEQRIFDKVKALNIENKVIFVGTSHEVHKLMNAMDVFVFPSLFEGLGMVAVEAQASGLPTICASTVPIEAKVSDLFEQVDLRESPSYWAKVILSKTNCINQRKNMYLSVLNAGYDVKESAKILQEKYFTISRRI